MDRSSGVLMHVTTLPGEYSCGALGEEARRWIDRIRDMGFTRWQVLPFCLPDEVNSPYKSHSAFSLNPYFIDLPTLCRQGLITEEELNAARQTTPWVCEFERLAKERLPLLAKAAERAGDTPEIRAFLKAHPHTEQFCRFMSLKAANGGVEWQLWKNDTPDEAAYRTWVFTQYECWRQWMELRA